MNCSYQAAINRNTLAKHKISARVIYITYKRNQFFCSLLSIQNEINVPTLKYSIINRNY